MMSVTVIFLPAGQRRKPRSRDRELPNHVCSPPFLSSPIPCTPQAAATIDPEPPPSACLAPLRLLLRDPKQRPSRLSSSTFPVPAWRVAPPPWCLLLCDSEPPPSCISPSTYPAPEVEEQQGAALVRRWRSTRRRRTPLRIGAHMRWCGLRDSVRSMDGGSSAGAGMRDGSVTERLVDSYPSVEASQLQGLKPCRGRRGHMRVQRTWGTDEAVEDMGDRGGWRHAVGWSSDDCLPLHPPTEIQAGAVPGVAASCRRERWSTAAVEDCSLLCLSYLALAWPTTSHR